MTEYLEAGPQILGPRDLWAHIFGDRHDTLELVSVRPDDWANAQYAHFSYPDQLDQADRWLQNHSVGRNVYHCAHLLLSPKKTTGATPRTKDNASAVLTLWADLDGSPLPDDLPRPTAIVESSPGKMHCYWRLTRPLQAHEAERLNKRIAYAIKDDLSGWDLTQLLRPVGTFNWKYPTAQPVTITHLDPTTRYDPLELAKLLPPLPEEAKPATSSAPATPVDLDDVTLIALARSRQPKFARLWDGNLVDYIDDRHPEGDRSRADAGFCSIVAFWTGRDAGRIDQWYRQSGLARDKWDRKLKNSTYGAVTIDKAIAGCGEIYTGARSTAPTPLEQIEASASDGADGCLGCRCCARLPQIVAQVNHLLEREQARDRLRKTGWSGEDRAALEYISDQLDDARRKGLAETKLFYPEAKKECGVGAATFTRVVKRIEAHQQAGDPVPACVVRGRTRNNKPQVRLTINRDGSFSGDLTAFAALRRDDPRHGGRRCRNHPDEKPVVRIVDQQLRRTVRQWVCPIDGQVVAEKRGPAEIVAETLIQHDPAVESFHDETVEEAAEQDAASEAYRWRPDDPSGPFHHETVVDEEVDVSCVYLQRDFETVRPSDDGPPPFHDETILPPPLIDDPIWPELDWGSKLRREQKRAEELARLVAGGSE